VEPLPETQAALTELAWAEPSAASVELEHQVERARQIVPELVGVSVTLLRESLTFTYVASSEVIRVLDGLQYLDGGPCVDAIRDQRVIDDPEAALDEQQWQLFTRAESVVGIASTLSLPVVSDGRAVCGINLYASRAGAFGDRHQTLADVFGAWAGGAVTNADLSFTTRFRAAEAPGRLQALHTIDKAIGIIASRQKVSVAAARRRLDQAGALAGVAPDTLARAVLDAMPD
jgi:GAF domain-containing protein